MDRGLGTGVRTPRGMRKLSRLVRRGARGWPRWDLLRGALSSWGGGDLAGRGSHYLGHLMDPAVGLAALQQLGR